MAAAVPCIATDVGDSGTIMSDGGLCVPPEDPAAMARAIADLSAMGPDGRRVIGARGRARVEANYSLPAIAARYAAIDSRELSVAQEAARTHPKVP